MELERTVSGKGQIVIPKDVRKKLGFTPGSELVFEVEEDKMTVKKRMSPQEIVEDFGNVPKKVKKMGIKGLESLIDEEYEIPRLERVPVLRTAAPLESQSRPAQPSSAAMPHLARNEPSPAV